MFLKCSLFCLLLVTPQLALQQWVCAKSQESVVEHTERKITELENFLADPARSRVHSLQGELIVAALHVVTADQLLGRQGRETDAGLPSETFLRMQRVLREALAAELHPREERAVRAVLEVIEEGSSASCEGELGRVVQF